VIALVPKLVAALVIVLVGYLLARVVASAVSDLGSSLLAGVSGGQVMAKGAGIAILVFGAFAAVDQLQIAPRIVTGLWYAILAIVVGSAVVAIGGGIKTMQRYWEQTATTAEQRVPQRAQQAAPAARFDDGDGAAAYADTAATREFPAERPSRPRRDR
jgi:hypothetical protein